MLLAIIIILCTANNKLGRLPKKLYTTVSYWCAKAAGVNTSIIKQTTNISCEDNYDREYSKLIVCSILIIINTN